MSIFPRRLSEYFQNRSADRNSNVIHHYHNDDDDNSDFDFDFDNDSDFDNDNDSSGGDD